MMDPHDGNPHDGNPHDGNPPMMAILTMRYPHYGRAVGSTGFRELTHDALVASVEQYKKFCGAMVEPPPVEPKVAKSGKKKKRKAAKK